MSFQNKNFVVIGGAKSGSIGFEFIKELFSAGVEKIAAFDVSDPSDAIAELKSLFPNKTIQFHKVDVRNRSEIESAYKATIDSFGSVDVMANCAGIFDEKRPQDVIEINLIGVMNSTMVAIDHMSTSQGGRGGTIMIVASVNGLRPYAFSPAYCASKFGVVGYIRSLGRKEWVRIHGIKFVLMSPGPTKTGLLSDSASKMEEDKDKKQKSRFQATAQPSDRLAKNLVRALRQSTSNSHWILSNGGYVRATL